ncbi:MAG TPA: hypothetical protein VFS90_08510 [Pyrinomonadaceae bacterium]|nr:hypothetical protein [Pyrinomonadaceae bacterium]
MDYGSSSLKTRKAGESFSFVFREYNMAGQSKHLEQLYGLIVDIGKDDLRAILFGDVDDAEENRDSDTVDEFGVAEINNERTAATIKLPATFALNLFPRKLVQVVARVNNRGGANTVRAY